MAKYNYHDVKCKANYGETVHEVNRKIMQEVIERFNHDGLIRAMRKVEEKLLFGVLSLLDKNAVKIATIKVRHGIIEQVYLNKPIVEDHDYKPVAPYTLNFERSIVNDSITWKNNKEKEISV